MSRSWCADSIHSWNGGLLLRARVGAVALIFLLALLAPTASFADEDGVSFWVPGFFSSLAATPQQPGWSLASIFYNTNVSGNGNVAVSREITIGQFNPALNASLSGNVRANVTVPMVIPTYVFA